MYELWVGLYLDDYLDDLDDYKYSWHDQKYRSVDIIGKTYIKSAWGLFG